MLKKELGIFAVLTVLSSLIAVVNPNFYSSSALLFWKKLKEEFSLPLEKKG